MIEHRLWEVTAPCRGTPPTLLLTHTYSCVSPAHEQAGKLPEALEALLGVEKMCRMGNDVTNLKEVVLFTVKLCK